MSMASKYIILVKDGEIVRAPIRKPAAPRKNILTWMGNCWDVARQHKAKRYAFRFGGQWQIIGDDAGGALRRFPADNEDAAAMYLLHTEGR